MASIVPNQMTASQRKKSVRSIISSKFPNYDPLVAMAEIAHDPDTELTIQVQCHKEIAQYLHAKLKSVEIQVEDTSKKSRGEIIERLKHFDTSTVVEGEVSH